MIEALSWLGRGALAAKQLDKAETYAKETERLARRAAKEAATGRGGASSHRAGRGY